MGIGDFFGRKKTFTTITALGTTLFLATSVMGENTPELIQDCADKTILELSQICKVSEGNMWGSADINTHPDHFNPSHLILSSTPIEESTEPYTGDYFEGPNISGDVDSLESSESTEAAQETSPIATEDPVEDIWRDSNGNPETGKPYIIVSGDTLSGIAKSLLKQIHENCETLNNYYNEEGDFLSEEKRDEFYAQVKALTVKLHEVNSQVIGTDADYIIAGEKLKIPSSDVITRLIGSLEGLESFDKISGLEDNGKWFNTSSDFTYEEKVDEMITQLENWKKIGEIDIELPEDMTLLKDHKIQNFLDTLDIEHIEFLNVLEGETGFLDSSEIELVKEKIAKLKSALDSQHQPESSVQSAPDQSSVQSGPDQSSVQSGPDQSSVQSGPDQSSVQSGPDQSSVQSGPDQSSVQSGPDQSSVQSGPDQSNSPSSTPEPSDQSPGRITFETPQTFEQLKSLITTKIPEGTSNSRYTSILNTLNRIGSLEDELPTLNENASFSEKLEYFEQNLKILGTKKNLIDRNPTTLQHFLRIEAGSVLEAVESDIGEVEQEIEDIVNKHFLSILYSDDKEFLSSLIDSTSFLKSYLNEDQIEKITERITEIENLNSFDNLLDKSYIELNSILSDEDLRTSIVQDIKLQVSGSEDLIPTVLNISDLEEDYNTLLELYSEQSILDPQKSIFTSEQFGAYISHLSDLESGIRNLSGYEEEPSIYVKKGLLDYVEHKFFFILHQNGIVEDIIKQSNIIKGLGDEVKYGGSGESGKAFTQAVDELHKLGIINDEVLDEIDGTWAGGQENVASVKDYLNRSGFSNKFLGVDIEVNESKISYKFQISEPTLTDPAPSDPTLTDPALTDPTLTDPAPTDPAPSDPTLTDPALTDPAPSDPTLTDPALTDPAPTDPAPVYDDITDTEDANTTQDERTNNLTNALRVLGL